MVRTAVIFLCLYHILTSSVRHQSTDAQQNPICLFACMLACDNDIKNLPLRERGTHFFQTVIRTNEIYTGILYFS